MLKKIFTVSVVVMTIFWAVGLAAFVPVAQAAVVSGDLIKASGAAVYYMGADGKRYVFPNEKTYMTWYPNFSGVKTITDGELAAIMIGGNVTMRPGVKMGKITTDPKVYAIGSNGTLRWVTTAAIAECLYGASWSTQVADISDAFFVNYTIGAPINACADFVPATATSIASSINVDKGLSTGTNPGATFNATTASDNPGAQTVPGLATSVAVLKFNLSGNGTLNEIVLKRTGLGSSADYANVYIYNGDVRITSGRTISSDSNTVTFSNINLAISGSVTLTVKVDISATAVVTDQNAISLQAVNGNVVAGVNGNLITIGNALAGDATVAGISTSWNVTLGTAGAELAKFSIAANQHDLTVYGITLRQGGRLANTNIANLVLKSTTYQLATAAAMTSDKAVLVLAAPFTIPKGQTKNFTLYGDITGGRTGDTVQFYVDQKTDLNIVDALYNVGANIIIGVTFDQAGDQTVTMQGGQLTLANAGPASTSFSANSTGNAILKVNMSSERNVTVRKSKIVIAGTAPFATADLARIKNIKVDDLDTNTSLISPISSLTAFFSVGDNSACTTFAKLPCYFLSTDSYDMTAGQTRHLAVKVDFDTATTNGAIIAATYSLNASNPDAAASANSNTYDNDSGEFVLISNIIPFAVSGVNQTVTTSSLNVTLAGLPASGAFVKGSTAVDALGINLAASIADSVQVNRLTARIYADRPECNDGIDNDLDGNIDFPADAQCTSLLDNSETTAGYQAYVPGTWATATGAIAANTVVLTASLYDGSTLVKGPVNLSLVDANANGVFNPGEYYKADFTNLAYPVAAGAQKKLVVRLSLSNNISAATYTAVDLVVPTDLEVQNSLGNLIVPGPGASFNATTAKSPYQTIGTAGTLAVAVDGNTPTADLAVGGSTNLNMTKYRVTSGNEAFTVTGAQLVVDDATAGKDVTSVTVTYPNAQGGTNTKTRGISGNLVLFSDGDLDMYVPVNSSATLTIAANLNTTAATATDNTAIKICLDNGVDNVTPAVDCAQSHILTNAFIALGVSSNTKIYGDTDIASVNNGLPAVKAQTLVKTKVTAVNALAGGPTSVGPQTVIGKFTLSSSAEAGSGQNSTLNQMTLQIGGSLIDTATGDGNVTVNVWKGSAVSGNEMGTGTIAGVDAGTSTASAITIGTNNEFTGDITVLVTANTSGDTDFSTTPTNKNLSTTLTTYQWNDGIGNITPVAGIPVVPTNALTF